MRDELLQELGRISGEERDILEHKTIDKSLYTTQTEFNIENGKLLTLGRYIVARPHTRFIDFPLHSHNYIEIMYVCSGEITHVIDGKELRMVAGDILFMNQHVQHSIKKTSEHDIGINFIILPAFFDIPLTMMKEDRNNVLAEFLIASLRIHDISPQYLHFRTASHRAIENLMENIIESLMNGRGEENIMQFTMGLVFLHLLSHIETISEDSLLSGNDVVAETALRYIESRYRDASLRELAQSMNQSLSNMSKIIKKNTGMTFSERLQQKRFQQAVVFLKDTDMTVSEILNAVGYENSSHFYRLFRKRYGVSPRKFRLDINKS